MAYYIRGMFPVSGKKSVSEMQSAGRAYEGLRVEFLAECAGGETLSGRQSAGMHSADSVCMQLLYGLTTI